MCVQSLLNVRSEPLNVRSESLNGDFIREKKQFHHYLKTFGGNKVTTCGNRGC